MAKQKRAMFPKKALATVDGSGNQDGSAHVRKMAAMTTSQDFLENMDSF